MKRPMLACSITPEQLRVHLDRHPETLAVQPKLDGIRCIKTPSGLLSRTGKPIRNRYLQQRFASVYDGIEGELIARGGGFSLTQSIVNSTQHDQSDAIEFVAFDHIGAGTTIERYQTLLWSHPGSLWMCASVVPMRLLSDYRAIMDVYRTTLDQGHEGIMLRRTSAPYKHGRSTLGDMSLVKLKPRSDDEAIVTGIEQEVTADGPVDRVGVLLCDWRGTAIRIGTGFTHAQAAGWYSDRDTIIGRRVTFYYQGIGSRGLPRFPALKGIRESV